MCWGLDAGCCCCCFVRFLGVLFFGQFLASLRCSASASVAMVMLFRGADAVFVPLLGIILNDGDIWWPYQLLSLLPGTGEVYRHDGEYHHQQEQCPLDKGRRLVFGGRDEVRVGLVFVHLLEHNKSNQPTSSLNRFMDLSSKAKNCWGKGGLPGHGWLHKAGAPDHAIRPPLSSLPGEVLV